MKCPYCIKKCSKCNRLLVAYKGNFNKAKTGKYNLRNDCKKCRSGYNSSLYQENQERYQEYRDTKKEKTKEYNKKYYQEHKEELQKYSLNYANEHKNEKSEYRKEYYQNNKDKFKDYANEWQSSHPEYTWNKNNKRRLKEDNQGNGISKEQWLEMMIFFDWKCAYSGEKLTDNTRTIDHITSLKNNGEHEVWNCVPMIKEYNCSKQHKDMMEWYIQQPFYSEERLIKIQEWIKYAECKYKNNKEKE